MIACFLACELYVLMILRACAHSLGIHLVPTTHRHRIHGFLLLVIGFDMIRHEMRLYDIGSFVFSVLLEAEDHHDETTVTKKGR